MIIRTKVITEYHSEQTIFHSFSDRMRPRSIDELLLPDDIKTKFQSMKQKQRLQNVLFYGDAGTGKTTCADLIVADSSELVARRFNAALDRSVSDVSEIREFAVSPSLLSQHKVAILDEADNMKKTAQKALLSVIEESTSNYTRDCSTKFILIANDKSKLIEPLVSRCLPICFNHYSDRVGRAKTILLKTIKSRLSEIDCEFDDLKVRRIIDSHFPDSRAIANRIEFEMIQ
jgi:replication-associated recombination protein RarA